MLDFSNQFWSGPGDADESGRRFRVKLIEIDPGGKPSEL